MALNVNTIVLTNPSIGYHDEGKAAAAVKPGMSVEMNASGEYILSVNATNGIKVVKEDALQGRTVADAYAIGERLFFYQPLPGDRIHVLVKAGQTVAVGSKGTFLAGYAEVNATKTFEFLEASSGALGADTLLKARIL